MKSRFFLILGVLAAYTLLHVHPLTSAEPKEKPAGKAKPTGKQTAAQLLADAQKALAYTVKASRAAGEELSPENPAAKPFLASLQKISKALDGAEKGLAAKDGSFFKEIGHAQSGVAQMQVAWDLTESSNPEVIKGGKALGGAVSALHNEYGPMAQRQAKGGELTSEEKQNFQKLKADQGEFRKKLHHLMSGNSKDPVLVKGLKGLSRRSLEIEKAPNTVDAYTSALDFLSTISGILEGYSYYAAPSERKAWSSVHKPVTTWTTYYYAPVSTYDWSYTEIPVEVYDDYGLEVSTEEMTSEESYIEESSFEMTEEESEEVAESSDDISADEASDDEMESEQEDVDEQEEDADMDAEDDGADDSAEEDSSDDGGDEGSDDGGDDAGDDGGDDGGGDDGGGDDGGDE